MVNLRQIMLLAQKFNFRKTLWFKNNGISVYRVGVEIESCKIFPMMALPIQVFRIFCSKANTDSHCNISSIQGQKAETKSQTKLHPKPNVDISTPPLDYQGGNQLTEAGLENGSKKTQVFQVFKKPKKPQKSKIQVFLFFWSNFIQTILNFIF